MRGWNQSPFVSVSGTDALLPRLDTDPHTGAHQLGASGRKPSSDGQSVPCQSSGLCFWVLLCLTACFLWGKARDVQQLGQNMRMEAVCGGGSPAKVKELRADL